MTGGLPRDHGIVANGWLFRDLMEVWLWRQSNRLVAGEKIWEAGKRRDPSFTTANLFWWYNMAAQPRHRRHAAPDLQVRRPQAARLLCAPAGIAGRTDARARPLSAVPVLGPGDDDRVARAGSPTPRCHVRRTRSPTLTLVYLPHLDYDLQRFGPDDATIATSLAEIDAVAGDLIADAERDGARVIVLSEYGITPVSTPIHINRALRAGRPPCACGSRTAASCSTFRNRARSPSPTTRSRTSTWRSRP